MAKFTRTKLLTDSAYSPTVSISQAARRAELDGSIQEIQDILYSQEVGKGASQVGINGLAYATVQDLAQVVSDSGTGTAPPADSVGLAQQATTVKTGLLSSLDALLVGFTSSFVVAINKIVAWIGNLTLLNTADKTSVVNAVNELVSKTQFSKYVLAAQLDKSDATLADITGFAFPVVAGKTYKIEIFAKYQTGATTTGIKFNSYLPTGAGTIIGNVHAYLATTVSGSADVLIGVVAIGASGLTGSGITTSSVIDINTDLYLYSNLVFKCTSTGEFRQQFASEVAAIARLMAGATMLVSEV